MTTPSLLFRGASCALLAITALCAQGEPVPLFSVRGQAADDPFAVQAVGLDDLDGDGFADFAIGRAKEGDFRGTVDLHSGRTGQRIARLRGRAGRRDSFGSSIARLGDLDGDGVGDFAVGAIAYKSNGVAAGGAVLFSGATRQQLHVTVGAGEGDLYGSSIADAGDVDGDGVPDVVVGAPENGNPVANYGPGFARVLSGRDFRLLHEFHGVELGDEFGATVTGVGDVDRDGHADVMVGSLLELRGGQGSARIYSGSTGAPLFEWFAEPGTDHFGLSIGSMGDVDGDGFDDFYSSQISMTNLAKGAVLIYSGRDGSLVQVLRGAASSGVFGRHVRAPGDVDFDGIPDLLVSDPADNGTGVRLGAVHLYSGRTWSKLWTLRGPAPGSGFAGNLALLDDIDGDTRPEMLAAYARWPGDPSWRAEVLTHSRAVTHVGRGCADPVSGGVAPRLDSALMSVGQQVPVTVRGARPESLPGMLLVSSVAPTGLPFGSCAVYLDPLSIATVQSFATDIAGRWFGTLGVPADTGLIDQRMSFQALLFAPRGGLDLTQGLQVTIGR